MIDRLAHEREIQPYGKSLVNFDFRDDRQSWTFSLRCSLESHTRLSSSKV